MTTRRRTGSGKCGREKLNVLTYATIFFSFSFVLLFTMVYDMAMIFLRFVWGYLTFVWDRIYVAFFDRYFSLRFTSVDG